MNLNSFEPISWQTIFTLIAAITALISSFVGPFVAYKIATKQITAAVSTAEQKEWLQSFRKELADYIGIALSFRTAPADPVAKELQRQKLLIAHTLIALRLSGHKESHILVEKYLGYVTRGIENPKSIDMDQFLNKLTLAGRKLINDELAELKGNIVNGSEWEIEKHPADSDSLPS